MTWNEIRKHFPQQWLLVEATEAHSEKKHRVLDALAVLGSHPTGKSAMDSYLEHHRKMPLRELFVLHTSREKLEIEEIPWHGIRGVM